MTSHTDTGLQFERILFFSDAVFAIAITLLIIEIKVPQMEHGETSRDFLVALLNLTPKLIGFLLSFFVIGAYWVGHHRIYGHIVRWDYGLVWLNILFLATIAFMPFSTAFFSEYLRFVPLIIYSSTFAVAGLLQLAQWRYALRHDLVEGHEDPMVGKYITWRMTLLPMVGLISILIGYFDPKFSGFAFFLIPIFQRILRSRFGGLPIKTEKAENLAA